MDSRETPDPDTGTDTNGVAVRVLLPDGGQMEAPEQEGEETESEEPDEEDAEAPQDEPEGEQAEGEEGEEEADEGEDSEAEAGEGEDAEEKDGESAEAEEAESAEGEEAEGEEGEEEETEREEAVSDEGARLLHLNVDGLFLDLLGLEVDLDTVTLDLTAVEGESKLLGNLLSAVSGLLGGDPLSNLLPDNPLSGLLGGGEGDEEGEGEGSGLLPDVHPIQRAKALAGSLADAIRGAFEDAGKSIVAALPLEELLAQFLQAVVDQLLDTADGGDEAETEEAAASA